MLKKNAATRWIEECQKAFNKINEYLSKPPVLVPPNPGRPLLLYLSVLDGDFGCVLGQHDETGRKEQEKISSKHMMVGEYSSTELQTSKEWVSDVVLVSETGQHYPVSAKLKFSCTNNMAEYEAYILGLRLAIDMNIQELLVIGDSDLLVHRVLGEWATKNTKILPYLYYVQELIKRFTEIEFKHVPRIQNEFADALTTLSPMIQHPHKKFIDPIPIGIHKQLDYCAYVEEESDVNPSFHDIKE
ncbi:uncharacterized protein [Nicotiana tomentosiformis]|uniref:uncharacterized protein n=1 Tax=Nicotiana tomentosiformis TaxID=4098 RepID=UPI00388CE077